MAEEYRLNLWSRWLLVCLLRLGPQEIDYSPRLTRAMVALAVLGDLVHAYVIGLEQALPRVLVSLLFLLGVPWLLLTIWQRQQRYAQSLAALAGTGVLFALIFIPVAALAQAVGPVTSPETMTPAQIALGWLVVGLSAWRLIVVAHIFRHALDLRLFPASLLAIAWFVSEVLFNTWLFPGSS